MIVIPAAAPPKYCFKARPHDSFSSTPANCPCSRSVTFHQTLRLPMRRAKGPWLSVLSLATDQQVRHEILHFIKFYRQYPCLWKVKSDMFIWTKCARRVTCGKPVNRTVRLCSRALFYRVDVPFFIQG